jgi:hypothetical protein
MIQVWLDLEETIINSWHEGLLMNVDKIKKQLELLNVCTVNIWSFAIWDEDDHNEFVKSGMKESIERALNVTINGWLCVDDIQKAVQKYENITYESRSDFMSLNGKHWSFIKYCLYKQRGHQNILIDDVVGNWLMSDADTNTIVQLINIKNI